MNDSLPELPATPKVNCALEEARRHREQFLHMRHVAGLALALWRGLEEVHALGFWEEQLLCCAALLHDVGVSVNPGSHHKHSRDMILKMRLPSLTSQERDIVAQVARYHRKAHPSRKHKGFSKLPPHAQRLVRQLGAILRVADGLDRAWESAVAAIEAAPAGPGLWVVGLWGGGDLGFAAWGAERKAGLSREVYDIELRFEPRGPVGLK